MFYRRRYSGGVLLSGCASIVSKTNYNVNINSNVPNTTVKIKQNNGMPIFSGTVPCMVNLKTSSGFFSSASYAVEATTPDGCKHFYSINSSFNPWFLGNFIIGGIIGMGIDGATGAVYKLDENLYIYFEDAPPKS